MSSRYTTMKKLVKGYKMSSIYLIKAKVEFWEEKLKPKAVFAISALKDYNVLAVMNFVIEQKKNEKFDLYKKASVRVWKILLQIFKKQYELGFESAKKFSRKIGAFNQNTNEKIPDHVEPLFNINAIKIH